MDVEFLKQFHETKGIPLGLQEMELQIRIIAEGIHHPAGKKETGQEDYEYTGNGENPSQHGNALSILRWVGSINESQESLKHHSPVPRQARNHVEWELFVSTWKKTSVNARAFRKTGELKMESLRGLGIRKKLPFSAKENLTWRQTFWV